MPSRLLYCGHWLSKLTARHQFISVDQVRDSIGSNYTCDSNCEEVSKAQFGFIIPISPIWYVRKGENRDGAIIATEVPLDIGK